MDEQPTKNRGAEIFEMGSVAVTNTDNSAGEQAVIETSHMPKIGSLAIANSDEKLLTADEHLVKTIYKHPVGIIGIYAEMILGVGIVFILVALAIDNTFGKVPSDAKPWIVAAGFLVSVFIVSILSIVAYVYRKSRLLIADKSIVSTVQRSLFSKKISRLSMTNVEDVTAEQRGILPTLFSYGTLTIQTAGEEDNFVFPLCPHANEVADEILEARQAFVRSSD